jgi:hypothetical protein
VGGAAGRSLLENLIVPINYREKGYPGILGFRVFRDIDEGIEMGLIQFWILREIYVF